MKKFKFNFQQNKTPHDKMDNIIIIIEKWNRAKKKCYDLPTHHMAKKNLLLLIILQYLQDATTTTIIIEIPER